MTVNSIPDYAELPLDAQIGSLINGKYRIEKVLGFGGIGVVFAAHHLLLDEPIAIKFLLASAMQEPDVVTRFFREARAAVKIKSEHVVRVFDVGFLSSGTPYMVMEYLEGCDVSTLMAEHGVLSIEQAVEFILEACDAIAEAHGLGIVHRDLKPANLYCVRRSDGLESIKILDFGISKVSGNFPSSDPRLTQSKAVFGSPLYMSPEQIFDSHDVDDRTDIWSLGASLYEMLTLRAPFEAASVPDILTKTTSQPPPSLRAIRGEVPVELEAAVFRCLEKDRNRRYRNVAELALALEPFGPRSNRELVGRIERTIQVFGLSPTTSYTPPSSRRPTVLACQQTDATLGQATPLRKNGTAKRLLGLLGGVVIAGTFVSAVLFARETSRKQNHLGVPEPAIVEVPSILPLSSEASVVPVDAIPTIGVLPVSSAASSSACAPTKSSRAVNTRSTRKSAVASSQTVKAKPGSVAVETPKPKTAKGVESFLDRQY